MESSSMFLYLYKNKLQYNYYIAAIQMEKLVGIMVSKTVQKCLDTMIAIALVLF